MYPAWDLAGKYATDVFTEQAIQIIRNHPDNKALFLMISHLAPHAANDGKLLEAPQETIDKFKHIVDSNRRTYAGNLYFHPLYSTLQLLYILFYSSNGFQTR